MTEDPRPKDEAELVELIRSIDVAAPRQLHERVEAMIAERERRAPATPRAVRRPGLRLRFGAVATALVAAAVAVALAVSGSGGGGLSLAQASAVTLRGATMPAPGESTSNRRQLTASVEGVIFPYWGERFGWRAAGSRVDRVGGRTLRTVFYENARGNTVGYAIVAGGSAPSLAGGTVERREGTDYRLHDVNGAEVVTWTRDGHLCVVSGRGVNGATLLRLASWDDQPRAS
jgi:hypothetical protein